MQKCEMCLAYKSVCLENKVSNNKLGLNGDFLVFSFIITSNVFQKLQTCKIFSVCFL